MTSRDDKRGAAVHKGKLMDAEGWQDTNAQEYVAAADYEALRQRFERACAEITRLSAPSHERQFTFDACPDCGRVKARDAHQVGMGYCPKWYAIRDPEAAVDCERHVPASVLSTTARSGERITPAELEHLIEWHDACAKFSVQSDNFVGETAHTARATALRKVDELLCDVGARSAPSATPRNPEGLLPCPFCGGEPHLQQNKSSEDPQQWNWYVSHLCGWGGVGIDTRTKGGARETAIAAWNRRADGGKEA